MVFPDNHKLQKTINLLWPVGYVSLVSGLIFIFFHRWAYDDPYITFRYARNLSKGLGFIYNTGEFVLSTTTPLFTILLAILGLFWPNFPELANFIGAICLALGGYLIWRLGNLRGSPAVSWLGLLLYPIFPLLLSTLGSEMPLYLVFVLGSFLLYAKKSYYWLAVASGLLVLIRADGILVPIIIFLDFLFREKRLLPPRNILIFSIIIAIWFVFSFLYFGSFFPATLKAKQHQGAMSPTFTFYRAFLDQISYYKSWFYQIQVVFVPLGLLFIFLKDNYPWMAFIFWGLGFFAAYSFLSVSPYFWYFVPFAPVFLILQGLGLEFFRRFIAERIKRPINANSLLRQAFTLFLLVIIPMQVNNAWQLHKGLDNRLGIYSAVGKWIQKNTPIGSQVGTLEVGIIGYFSDRIMVDFSGLIQPEIAAQIGPNKSFADSAWFAVKKFRPDYLVLHDKHFPRLENEYCRQACLKVKRFIGAEYGYYADMDVYQCRPKSQKE